jgi:hypothetical protein
VSRCRCSWGSVARARRTTGKVERFQQTLKKWLTAQPDQPATLHQLNALLARFRTLYNQERPHRGIGRRTPATAYTALPKAVPGEPTDRTHTRVRVDKVNNGKITLRYNGQLYSIGIGRAHNATPVTALTRDSTSPSSPPTPAKSCANSPSTPTRRYQPRTPENP